MGKTTGTGSRKAKPSAADREAAARLLDVWTAKKRELKLTQDKLAERLGGKSQGLVSQYLHGKIPLNYHALLVFCDALRIQPEAIRSDLPEQRLSGSSASQAARLDPTIIEHAKMYARSMLAAAGIEFDPADDVGTFIAAYTFVADPTIESRAAFDANIADRARPAGGRRGESGEDSARGRRKR